MPIKKKVLRPTKKQKKKKKPNTTIWRDGATSEPDQAGMLKLLDWGYKTARINMLKALMDNYEQ